MRRKFLACTKSATLRETVEEFIYSRVMVCSGTQFQESVCMKSISQFSFSCFRNKVINLLLLVVCSETVFLWVFCLQVHERRARQCRPYLNSLITAHSCNSGPNNLTREEGVRKGEFYAYRLPKFDFRIGHYSRIDRLLDLHAHEYRSGFSRLTLRM